nr:ribonuclease H-like domain-containing protein [Tanacetum cinerariifolium]
HQVTPKECHLHAVKRIFRYLKVHPKLGLWYPKESPFDLVAYSDSDYGGATQDRKSTTEGCQFFGRSNKIMARLQFCDYHNMVGILEKSEYNVEFHLIVDFVEASPLRYALTFKPTAYVSHIRQFWSTARIETTEEGTKILATVDGILRTVSESSLRRNLKLKDEEEIRFNEFSSNIATALVCLATNRTYNFSKMIFDGMGEGSGTPTEPHNTPSPEAQQSSPTTHSSPALPHVTTAPISNVTPSDTPHLRQYTRRARIAQSLALPPIANEPASPLRDVSQGEACPTVSSLDAKQDGANIAKTSTLPHESTSRVTSLAVDEGKRFGDDAPIKRRRLDVGEEVAERVSDDTEEMATVLTSMDAATVLSGRVAEVPTGSVSIPPATEVPTGSKEKMVETDTPQKKKNQEQMDIQMARQLKEEMERDAQRMNEQIIRDAEVARIHAEEELQMMINSLDRRNETTQQRKPWSKKQKRDYYMIVIKSNLGWKVKDFRGMTFEEIEAKFTIVWKQIKNFISMGSKKEAERFKRKGIRLEQESAMKLKISEEGPEEVKTPDEVPEEKVKEMMQVVPIEEIIRLEGSSANYQFFVDLLKHLDREDLNQLWALVKESLNIRTAASDKEMELWVELKRLYEPDDEDQLWTHTQNLMHALVEWKLYDTCGVHHVTSKDREIFMLVEKDYPLRKGLAIVMISYKLQVENYSQMASDLILKIYKIANRPRQEDD